MAQGILTAAAAGEVSAHSLTAFWKSLPAFLYKEKLTLMHQERLTHVKVLYIPSLIPGTSIAWGSESYLQVRETEASHSFFFF